MKLFTEIQHTISHTLIPAMTNVWDKLMEVPKQRLTLTTYSFTDPGKREQNQDSTWSNIAPNQKDFGAFVVADGLGGHQGGQMASRMAVQTIEKYFTIPRLAELVKQPEEEVIQTLHKAILAAHENIRQKAQADVRVEDMKTTCVALIILNNKAYWSTVGDSRLYLFRNRKNIFKSRDHSVVQMLLDMGEITSEEEMLQHPDRNRVLKTLGTDDGLEPVIETEVLKSGDCFLLCTDGFWEYMTVGKLEQRFQRIDFVKKSTQDKAYELFEAARQQAKKNPKSDNLTLQLVEVT